MKFLKRLPLIGRFFSKGNPRKFFHLKNDKHITLEAAWWDGQPTLMFQVDGMEREVMFAFWILGIQVYITFGGFLKKNWYPEYKSQGYGMLPATKEISWKFHNAAFWWAHWYDDDNDDWGGSKWRRGSFNFVDFIKGKHQCEWVDLETQDLIAGMLEGDYPIRVTKRLRIDSWDRWPTKRSISWEVKAGHEDPATLTWIDNPIPHPGKGESAHDLGEDGSYNASIPHKWGKKWNHTHMDAAGQFIDHINSRRDRYGGKGWIPEIHRKKEKSSSSGQAATPAL